MSASSNVHFSSASVEHATPQDLFDIIDAEFGITLDVCATSENAKCANYFTKEDDGLTKSWGKNVCWMNPPYARGLTGKWMQKAGDAASKGATVICLVPARTDTVWWHENVWDASEVRFLRGRLKFGGSENSAPFPSAIVVYRPTRTTWPSGIDAVTYTLSPVSTDKRWVTVHLQGDATCQEVK